MQTTLDSKAPGAITTGGWLQTLAVISYIAILTALLIGPLWHPQGIPGGNSDLRIHILRAAAVEQSFEQGVIWPRWVPDVYRGLGAPVFHHYSPGLYWLVAAVHWAGIRLDTAFRIVITCAFFLSGMGTYGWLRKIFSQPSALAGTALFLAQPHFIFAEYYYLGDYPQMLALLLLPVCLWAVTALHFRPTPWYWLFAVVALSALVLSHNLTAIMGAVILLLNWLFLALVYRRVEGLVRCALAALVAASVTAAFWLPALVDLPFVQFENALKVRINYKAGFYSLLELTSFQPAFLDSSAGNPLMPPAFTFGVIQWLALGLCLISSVFARSRERRLWGLAGCLLALFFLALTMPFSEPVWNSLPWLNFLQFRFRLLPFATLGSLSAAALTVDVWSSRHRWIPAIVLLLGSILPAFPYLFPNMASFTSFWSVEGIPGKSEVSGQEQTFDWDYIVGTGEFLVRGADMDLAKGVKEEPEATPLYWHSPHQAVADLPSQSGPSLLRLHFHPGWAAGQGAVLEKGTSGWTQVARRPDSGEQLEIRWAGTTSQHWGQRISTFGIFVTAAGIAMLARKRQPFVAVQGGEAPDVERRGFPTVVVPMTATVLLVLLARHAVDQYSEGPYIWDSPPGHVPFSIQGEPTDIGDSSTGQMTLLGWKLLSSPTPKPGESIIIRLFWRANQKIDEDMHTLLHLYSPSLKHSWAADAQGTIRIPTKIWDPDKYYIETMFLPIPLDVPPLTLSLAAGLSSSTHGRLDVTGSDSGLMPLRDIEVAPVRPGMFQQVRAAIETPAETADGMRLQGYDLASQGEDLTLRLFWETGDGVSNDWITFIHMLDGNGDLVAQFDGPPLGGLLPTSQWHGDALYIDRREITLPVGLAQGDYHLRLGLYDFASGERLPLRPRDAEDNQFEDGQLLVRLDFRSSEELQDSCYICSGDQ